MDPDDKTSIKQLFDFANDVQFLFATFVNLLPIPETPIYRMFDKENRLLYKKWWLEDLHPYFMPLFRAKNFTVTEMKSLGSNCLDKYYSFKNIFKRFIKSKYNIKIRFFILFANIFIKYFYKKYFS